MASTIRLGSTTTRVAAPRFPALKLPRFSVWAMIDFLADSYTAHSRRAAIMRELNTLDATTLEDLGLERNDFKALADGTYRR